MADKRDVDEIVTTFLLKTTRLRQQPGKYDLPAVACCALMTTERVLCNAEAHFIPQTTGSVAEFYIEPMLPHIGDIDVMYHASCQLVIPGGYPPPRQLPDEFDNHVKVYEMIDEELFPGYVYLESRYLLTECPDDDRYHAVNCDKPVCLVNPSYYCGVTGKPGHGPATVTAATGMMLMPVDAVHCVRCLVWPPQASHWPTRHRNYGWPDSSIVDRIISVGCDVVGVAHRRCRQDETIKVLQWRLSFSRAEILLINNWIPTQQIVYHLLRVFMKNGLFIDDADNSAEGTLSNYHMKTLMLWECELKPGSWWTDDLSFVRICVELLHRLAALLNDAQCPHYFINDCNLIDISLDVEMTALQLFSVDEVWFSTWFVDWYIRKCSQLCPNSVSRLFNDISTTAKLRNVVSAIAGLRIDTTLRDLWHAFRLAQHQISAAVSKYCASLRSMAYLSTELAKIGSHLTTYFKAVAFLHVCYKVSRNGFCDELMDALGIIVGLRHFAGVRGYSSPHSSVLSICKAAKLMKVVANKSPSTVQLIEIELSKAYLYRALRCKNHDSDSIYCLANVYLAVLYYATEHYQMALDHCALVTRSQDHSQCSSRVVQGELLPNFDHNVSNVLGLAVFYQHVRTAALSQQQRQYVGVFTTELFAHYLLIQCLPMLTSRRFTQTLGLATDEIHRYGKHVRNKREMFTADALLFKSVSPLSQYTFRNKPVLPKQQKAANPAELKLNTSAVAGLLMQSAVEHLTTFRQLEVRDFGSIATIVITDFEALYAYKCRDYQRCLELCRMNVRTLLSAVSLEGLSAFPESIQLFDDDIVSLIALMQIVDPDCRDHTAGGCVSQLTLSLYLMTQCQLKLGHSVTSLSQTLTYIRRAQRKIPLAATLDQLTLKLAARKVVTYMVHGSG